MERASILLACLFAGFIIGYAIWDSENVIQRTAYTGLAIVAAGVIVNDARLRLKGTK